VLVQAGAFCTQQGKQLLSTNMTTTAQGFELVFKCVTPAEAAAGYSVQPAPNVVIERRER
jgi:hypothetical protein